MWIWAREEWIWIQVKFADEAQTTVPDSKLYSTNDVKKVATTFFVFCEFTTVFAKKSFSRPRPDFTPQTVLIHLKKAPDGMIVPAPEIENIQVRCLFCTRDRPPGRQISRNDDDLYPTCHCICTEDRWEFYQLVEKIWTRGRRPPNFFNVQLSFPNFWHRKMAVGSQQWPGTNVAEVAHSPRQRHSVTNLSVHLIEDSEDSKTHALCVKWSK